MKHLNQKYILNETRALPLEKEENFLLRKDNQRMKGQINDYPLWVASYNRKFRIRRLNWTFHQFTDRVRVEGIKVLTDGNDFNGSMEQLLGMCLK